MWARHASELGTQYLPLWGMSCDKYRIGWDYSDVAALQENVDTSHARVRADYEAGLIDLDEARVLLGLSSQEELQGRFAGKSVRDWGDYETKARREQNRGKTTSNPHNNSGSFAPGPSEGHLVIGPAGLKNGHLAGKLHPVTKVPFDNDGYPVFESNCDVNLPHEMVGSHITDGEQMRHATRELREKLRNNPKRRKKYTAEQLRDIEMGSATISGYMWHHHQDRVRLQLVDRELHSKTGHSGGRHTTGGRPRRQKKS
jgi:hypothetical protein